MSILEKEVWVTLHKHTIFHYEQLGYDIPKCVDKIGKLKFKNGVKILVKIKDLTDGSNVRVTKICDDCGKYIYEQKYNQIIYRRSKSDGKDRCKDCGAIVSVKTKKNNIRYERSLQYWAIKNDKYFLLDEFSSKNNLTPDKVFFTSNETYYWICNKCNNEYDMTMNNRVYGRNCPYCSGRRVSVGYNDLFTSHPNIAKMLVDKNIGYEITSGTHRKFDLKCQECGYIMCNKEIRSVVSQGISCPLCSDGLSYPEKFMIALLHQIEKLSNMRFETQKTFEWSVGRYDFYIPYLNAIIETHGLQHYEYTGFHRKLEKEQENDKLKECLAKENGIKKYIIIDCRESSMDFIKNNILISELSSLLDLSDVDWKRCNEFACNSLVKIVCDYWSSGIKNTLNLSELMKVSRSTIIGYLKKGAEVGWCDYNPKEEMSINGVIGGKTNNKVIVQLSINNEFIKVWNSGREAANALKILPSKITLCCQGKRNKTGGFKWMYKEDYEKQFTTV